MNGSRMRIVNAIRVISLTIASLALFGVARHAEAVTAAGTVIGNQATATYLDSSGTVRTTTSNLVQTTVSQVKSFTLTANGAKFGAPGATVYFPHTITNTGNGVDTYALNTLVAGGTVTQTNLTYYIDANGDGVPDNSTPITSSPALAAGDQFNFVVAASIPAAASAASTGTVTVPVGDTGGNSASNTDTTTVATSVVNVTKALSSITGTSPSGAAITVTLSYSNSGTVNATNLVLTDPLPTGMTYVTGSGRWSSSGSTALTDAAGGDAAGISYDFGATTAGTMTATIASVAAGTSGTLTFQVNINSGLAVTSAVNQALTTNIASFKTDQQTVVTNTNAAIYKILMAGSLTMTGQTLSSGSQGSTLSFSNVVTNNGSGTDSFDITYPSVGNTGNNYPAGTTFALYASDGVTSLLDTNGNGIPDTGPLAAGSSYTVILKVTLPPGAIGGPYAVTKTATSKFDPTKTATAADTLLLITNNSVDVTQNTARSDSSPAGTAAAGNVATTGFGTGTASIIATNSVTAQSISPVTTAFKLYVNNTSGVTDSYDLAVTSAIPTGYTVLFFADGGAGNCSTLGVALVNTGPLAAGSNRLVCAVVSVPSIASGNATPGTTNLTFRAQSPLTSASSDTIVDAVTLTTAHTVTLAPNQNQQTFAGNTVTYAHVLRNTGNASENVTFATGFLSDTQTSAGWTSTAYVDTNGNGIYDSGTDALITTSTTVTLAANSTQTIFVRVFAPASATTSSPQDVTSFTATYNGGTQTVAVSDTTSVTNGLLLTKTQVAGTCGSGLSSGAFSAGAITASANTAPGKCVAYQITATNTSTGAISTVILSDLVPANTTLAVASCFAPIATGSASVGGTATVEGSTGAVTATLASLNSSSSFNLTFCVKINP
jgi:trimeric autotransporter adhesin